MLNALPTGVICNQAVHRFHAHELPIRILSSSMYIKDNQRGLCKQLTAEAARFISTTQTVYEAETALSEYGSLNVHGPHPLVWAVAENYRFESAFTESRKLLNDIGDMMSVQVIIEGSMNSSNPYFSSSWRRNLMGGFIIDMGVHYIADAKGTHDVLCICDVRSPSTENA
ncbi:hypothetical protein ACLOJK_017387 [Asimina triloba]